MVLEINGTEITSVFQYSVETKDVESREESETGYTVRDLIRPDVYSLSVEVHGNLSEISKVLSLLKSAKLNVRFFDPYTNVMKEASMFKDSTKNKLVYLADQEGAWSTSFTLQEF